MTAAAELQFSIQKAIREHEIWTTRLEQTIASGKSDHTVAGVSVDNNCEFGQWLHGDPNARASEPRHEKVRKLHAAFHAEVGKILWLALRGNKAEALKALHGRTPYARLAADLTTEMLALGRD